MIAFIPNTSPTQRWAGNRAYMKLVNDWRRSKKEFLLRGTFKADEGFTAKGDGDFLANRWDSADGQTAILVWNAAEKPQKIVVLYPGQFLYAEEPEGGKDGRSGQHAPPPRVQELRWLPLGPESGTITQKMCNRARYKTWQIGHDY